MAYGGYVSRVNQLQKDILTSIALGQPLRAVMQALCERVEAIAPKILCSILRVDEKGSLRTLAAPSLPTDYCAAVDGVIIGPNVGSCGTAAFFARPIEVDNIDDDPLWSDYRALALSAGLRACWSFPIMAGSRCVGTFAFYSRSPRRMSKFERDIVSASVHLCAIAITDAEAREQIATLAFSDHLTGLANRAALRAQAGSLLLNANHAGEEIALLYMDLDGFKAVNDLHGHAAGDRVLQEVANRLRRLLPTAKIVVRLGGDEFVALVSAQGLQACNAIASSVIKGISGRYIVNADSDANLGVSIGIARCPTDGRSIDELLSHADNALYRSKRAGSSKFSFFDPSFRSAQLQRRNLEDEIAKAVERDELSLVYQPIVNARSGKTAGFEALMRWNHPVRGNVSPVDFIPAAEAVGAIPRLGRFALQAACKAATSWASPLRIAVNVSPLQITSGDFVETVIEILDHTKLRANRLELEVTESLFIADSDAALAALVRLKERGVMIALDDFGTGYSSLSTLRSFPFDRLKIDRQFVTGMLMNAGDEAIVRSVVAMARGMGLEVVAEGVELEEHKTRLRLLGCDFLQGYLFGKPQPVDAFEAITSTTNVAAVSRYSPPALSGSH